MISQLQIDKERITILPAQLPGMKLTLYLLQTLDTERAVDIDAGKGGDYLTNEKIVLLASVLLESDPVSAVFTCRIAEMAGKMR